MIQTLQCPSCGAPLEYDEANERETMRCHFCASTVMLPERPRPQVQQQNIRISFGRPRLRSTGSPKTAIIIIAVVLLIGGGILIGVINAVSRAVRGLPPSTSTNTRTAFNPPYSPPGR